MVTIVYGIKTGLRQSMVGAFGSAKFFCMYGKRHFFSIARLQLHAMLASTSQLSSPVMSVNTAASFRHHQWKKAPVFVFSAIITPCFFLNQSISLPFSCVCDWNCVDARVVHVHILLSSWSWWNVMTCDATVEIKLIVCKTAWRVFSCCNAFLPFTGQL